MENLQNNFKLILELSKLKLVFRNTITAANRKESSAEHSWSASMIVVILMQDLKKEFGTIDELKTIKLTLIHDIVEIYAGDVTTFDQEARKNKEKIEQEALHQLMKVNPEFGLELHDLWYEFEKKETLEAKIAKAADAICPIFQRLQSKQSYLPFNITAAKLEQNKYPHFAFSKIFANLYHQLITDLLNQQLISK